ncbi:SGNH/GDSL hydrolase family protein [Leucothrix sargassi]|nr:SGNH/GDSL hydrolase family protein [Leucothrix sargassi]
MTKKNVIIALLGFCLIGSLALNYVFYKKGFVPLHKLRLDPLELSYYASSTKAETNKATKPVILYYGDSRALSWPFIDNENYAFVNRAIGNQTSTQVMGRFNDDVVTSSPNVIVAQMCVNDLKMIPLFPSEKDKIIEKCLSNIEALIEEAKEIDARLVLTTVFPLGDVSVARKLLGTKEAPIIEAIDIVNSHIKKYENSDALVFDSYRLLVGENKKIDPRYSKDWLHLNAAGYQHLNEHLKQFIEAQITIERLN